jgi:hypothetical protein
MYSQKLNGSEGGKVTVFLVENEGKCYTFRPIMSKPVTPQKKCSTLIEFFPVTK